MYFLLLAFSCLVTPPGLVNSPTAFGTVPNAFLPAATPSKLPDAIRRSTSLSTLSGGDADSPQLVYPALEDSPSFSEAQSAPLTAATESSSTSLPKRKLSILSSLPSPSKRLRLADYLHATPGYSSVVINGVTYIPTEDITRLTASSMVINGVPYVPTGNITRSTRSPTGDTSIPFTVRGPSPPPTLASTSGKSRYAADPDEIEFITPPQSSRSLPVPSDIDISSRQLGFHTCSVAFAISCKVPFKDVTLSFAVWCSRTAFLSSFWAMFVSYKTSGTTYHTCSPARMEAIQKALAAVQNISPARSPSPTRPVPGPSPAPQRRSLLSQIDSIVLAPATSSALVQSPPPALFDDGGLSDDGCLCLELFDTFLAPTYINVLNLSPLDLAQKRSVFRCTIFTNLGCFVNPSRANPAVVQRVSSAKGTTSLCPSGVVKPSSLYSVIPVPLANSNIRIIREILLRPFQQEFQCLAGFFASAFSFDSVAFPASAGFQQPNRPPRYVETDHRLTVMGQFKANTSFTDPSTNTAFECEHNQLHELAIASYPLYGTGMVNLPPGSTVTVGYTAHTYSTQRHYRNIPTCVSLNVAFVILLALPAAAARLACSPLAVAPLPLTLNTLAPAYPVECVTSHINSIDEVVQEFAAVETDVQMLQYQVSVLQEENKSLKACLEQQEVYCDRRFLELEQQLTECVPKEAAAGTGMTDVDMNEQTIPFEKFLGVSNLKTKEKLAGQPVDEGDELPIIPGTEIWQVRFDWKNTSKHVTKGEKAGSRLAVHFDRTIQAQKVVFSAAAAPNLTKVRVNIQ
ncbi:hypothetical protein BDP27DRAFT_1541389 [Rhodocollybia butyracea]|uniref:Uncharacterized protein n=1 Tax=Rhodocollybia butyracea TaxID=206335 RepID=A0A9P5P3S3_9AGAR|nr:hypothetical protein BDP27DRAFT_1541389 [Rhodocollybia butyracea]